MIKYDFSDKPNPDSCEENSYQDLLNTQNISFLIKTMKTVINILLVNTILTYIKTFTIIDYSHEKRKTKFCFLFKKNPSCERSKIYGTFRIAFHFIYSFERLAPIDHW